MFSLGTMGRSGFTEELAPHFWTIGKQSASNKRRYTTSRTRACLRRAQIEDFIYATGPRAATFDDSRSASTKRRGKKYCRQGRCDHAEMVPCGPGLEILRPERNCRCGFGD